MDSQGKKLTKYKSDRYAKRKHALNPEPGEGNPDLYLTGEFQAGFNVDVRGDDVVFDSADSKTPALVEQYGDSIFGLTPNSRDLYRPLLLNPTALKIKEITGCI